MYDPETLAQLNGPEVRPPILWPDWRLQFELDLHMPLLDLRLALDPSERIRENDRAVFFHHLIDRATPLCHIRDETLIQMFKRTNSHL